MSARQPQLNAGVILAGRWQIQDFIGSGETGEVYGVRDTHASGSFALKLFWPSALGHAEVWSAVQQTMRTASGLGVEGVARALDFGIDANSSRAFFVTERVSWSALSDRVRLSGPLTPAEMAIALAVLARSLDAAHAAGVVHRDLKPDNVFVSPDNANWVRISDFGVGLLRSASPPPPGWGGSIGWVAPEAVDPNARSLPAMDIFALGLVTFFALSGGALHRAARESAIDPGALWQELGAPLDSASLRARELGASLDPGFDAWFQRAVSPAPQARFASVGEMAKTFDAIVRTLVAPHSQHAPAVQGIVAAIAQPLLFQPGPGPAPAPAASVSPQPAVAPSAAAPSTTPGRDDTPPRSVPFVRKRGAAPLMIGGAVALCVLTALSLTGLYRHRRSAPKEPGAPGLASANASASAGISATGAPISVVPVTTPSAPPPGAAVMPSAATPAATPPPSKATARAPAANHASAPTPKAVAANPAPPVTAKAAGASAAQSVAAKAAGASAVQPVAAGVASSAQPGAAKVASAAKPGLLARPKKKCASTFIPCK